MSPTVPSHTNMNWNSHELFSVISQLFGQNVAAPGGVVDKLIPQRHLQILGQHADEVRRVPQRGRHFLVVHAVQIRRHFQPSYGMGSKLLVILDRIDGLLLRAIGSSYHVQQYVTLSDQEALEPSDLPRSPYHVQLYVTGPAYSFFSPIKRLPGWSNTNGWAGKLTKPSPDLEEQGTDQNIPRGGGI